jgi:hypothetical protein
MTVCSIQTRTPDGHLHRVTYTRCRITTINSPDDEHRGVRNMWWIGINIYVKSNVRQVGYLQESVVKYRSGNNCKCDMRFSYKDYKQKRNWQLEHRTRSEVLLNFTCFLNRPSIPFELTLSLYVTPRAVKVPMKCRISICATKREKVCMWRNSGRAEIVTESV